MEEKKTKEMISEEITPEAVHSGAEILQERIPEESAPAENSPEEKLAEDEAPKVEPVKKRDIGYILLIVIFSVLIIAAPFINGQSKTVPRVLQHTWASDTVELTFSGTDKVVASYNGIKYEGNYVNGTTGTKLVIWMHFENAPQELDFLESTRENYLVYATGTADGVQYLEIDGVMYYKQ